LNSVTRAASESTVAVEGLVALALSRPVNTGKNIPLKFIARILGPFL
jgi:hypothetical protein